MIELSVINYNINQGLYRPPNIQTPIINHKIKKPVYSCTKCVLQQSTSAFQVFECLLPFLDGHRVKELFEPFHAAFPVRTEKGSNIKSHALCL